ncbi:MAG TPA: hypothetical protein PKC76_06250 [Saprospiraceae bacterium]|nr:hypothetical protein [Saprospiraceae bacterium]HMP23713.1 hypothetical protein [Saprospiraceae bacterium]
MGRILLIAALWPLLMPLVSGQEVLVPGQNYYEERKGIVYNQEFAVNFKLLTNGYSLGVDIGRLQTYYLTRFWSFEIGELKHNKEYRQSFDFRSPATNRISRAFVFGKQNNFIPLRIGFGEKRYLSEKARQRGVAVGLSYAAGPSLGFLKPYYLDLLRFPDAGSGDPFVRSERYSEENAVHFLNSTIIYGSSGFVKGFDEVSILPGAHAKFAVHFDWGAFDEFVKALDAGIMVDFYFRDVPIMVDSPRVPNSENSPIFINFYINLQLGKRW